MRLTYRFLAVFMILYIPTQLFAWGMNGHRITGQIAYNHLTGKAKRQIQQLLGNESLAISANYADFIKSDSTFDYISSWHYINIKTGLSDSQVKDLLDEHQHGENIYSKINWLAAELKKKDLDQQTKRFYLVLLVHFVGDLHQPMHVGRPEDLGGNRVKLFWFNEPTNLHRIWDEQLIEYQKLSYTEYAAEIDRADKKTIRQWQAQPIHQWVSESYGIAEKLYGEIKYTEQKMSYRYNFDHVTTMNQQLLKGGIRLAGMLNEIFS